MMNRLSEKEVVDILITKSKEFGEIAPRVVVVNRTVINPKHTIKRMVRFALIVKSGSDKLLNKLIGVSLDYEMRFYFVGSDINSQSDLDVEYLYFEAEIMPTISEEG